MQDEDRPALKVDILLLDRQQFARPDSDVPRQLLDGQGYLRVLSPEKAPNLVNDGLLHLPDPRSAEK